MKRILVIDDEADIREVIEAALELTRDWQVLQAASAEAGLSVADKTQPDAILLDVMMPGMDGPTAFARLQKEAHTRLIPVVLLTAKVQSADRRRFAALGVAGVIDKPFDPMRLAEQIEALLGWDG
ncbi:response regulator [Gloeobacter kilaueensis]|uniref:Response regulator receiver protein n=1 Tax=Gloeobacter kilaueensis (strain ATCC BAA-2537 / CCAP 1431/1 / ULC 316 / JS1) TaxID=1183438 RepID=U5QLL4_GLOK1|nr:response regulator [Gloeobacter kilaueensis]AGY58499.1 response regulator receiver protein [Gloeobacter kilaueensis JS1]